MEAFMSQFRADNQAIAHTNAPQTEAQEYLNYVADKRSERNSNFLAADEKMLRIREIVEQIANANVPVLITGESGTGKEVIARLIHQASDRANKPFVGINCAALPPSLLESELFGYERGAFTGANQRHLGKFEQANGGTLLLDEVTEIEPALQAKLLRTLQEKQVERLGGNGPVDIDVRIIATTNRNIVDTVNEGNFRQDLYYRLHVIQLDIPPLRQRPKDISLLSNQYLADYALQFGREGIQLSQEAANRLLAYPWPGNVRELQNVMQRAILMARGNVIRAEELPLEEAPQFANDDWVKTLPIGRSMRDVETNFIIETIKHHRGNRTHAAKTLGISLRTLRNKINEFTSEGLHIQAPTTGKAL